MNITNNIYNKINQLPERNLIELLAFIEFLNYKEQHQPSQSMARYDFSDNYNGKEMRCKNKRNLEMNGNRYFLDTNAIVALLQGHRLLTTELQKSDWVGINRV